MASGMRRARSWVVVTSVWAYALILPAHASPADGTWLLKGKLALQITDCQGALCGRIVWLRNPALRTPAMCGRPMTTALHPRP